MTNGSWALPDAGQSRATGASVRLEPQGRARDLSRRGERRGRWRWGLAGHAGPGQLSRCPHAAPRPCSRAARVESEGYPIQRAVSCIQSDSTRSGLPQLRETMTQRASEEDSSSAPVIPSGMKNDCGGHCAPSTSGVARDGDTSHSLPLQYRASTALAGWGHVPSPVPPQRAEVTGGAAHVPPPLRWSRASIDGIAAAQPAASAKSGVEKCDPSPPGPGAK